MSENIIEEIRKLKEDAIKYQNSKGRYVELAQRVKAIEQEVMKIAESLSALSKEIDPVLGVGKIRSGKSRIVWEDIIAHCMDTLNKGGTLDRKIIERAFPDLKPHDISNLMTRLEKVPSIRKEKDGKKVKLLLKREY